MTTTTGKFIDVNIPFLENGTKISASSQADSIFTVCEELIKDENKKFALIYSANYGQTRDLQAAYMANLYCAKIMGSNQAQVAFEIERMLGGIKSEFQKIFRIAPITTMNAYTNSVENWNADVLYGIVQTDLDRIENYLNTGWDVLGWQNQDTIRNPKSPYAIGGGIAKLPQFIHDTIQTRLLAFKKQY